MAYKNIKIKMNTILKLCFYILLIRIDNGLGGRQREAPEVTRQFKMRCTRRYSPGVCANHMSPVWTYSFQGQNCSERLGCANYFRSNRFKNYNICMRQCQGLAEFYLQMLEMEMNKNLSSRDAILRKGTNFKQLFSSIQDRKQNEDTTNREDFEDPAYDAEYEQGDNETKSIVYKDLTNDDKIFPPDVDQVDGEIRSHYDVLYP